MTASENEIFAALKCSVLDENRLLLCQNLEPRPHYPYLRSKRVISKEDEQEIESQTTTRQKVHMLIDKLMQRSMGYDHIVTSIIQERTQIFIAKQLNTEFEEKKKRLSALMTSKISDGSLPVITNGNSISEDTKILSVDSKRDSLSRLDQNDSRLSSNRTSAELESLPKPVMLTKTDLQEQYKQSRMESCENSLDDEFFQKSSISDSSSTCSRNESKA